MGDYVYRYTKDQLPTAFEIAEGKTDCKFDRYCEYVGGRWGDGDGYEIDIAELGEIEVPDHDVIVVGEGEIAANVYRKSASTLDKRLVDLFSNVDPRPVYPAIPHERRGGYTEEDDLRAAAGSLASTDMILDECPEAVHEDAAEAATEVAPDVIDGAGEYVDNIASSDDDLPSDVFNVSRFFS